MTFKESEFAMMNSKEIISQIEYTYVPFFLNIKNAQKSYSFFPLRLRFRGGGYNNPDLQNIHMNTFHLISFYILTEFSLKFTRYVI